MQRSANKGVNAYIVIMDGMVCLAKTNKQNKTKQKTQWSCNAFAFVECLDTRGAFWCHPSVW